MVLRGLLLAALVVATVAPGAALVHPGWEYGRTFTQVIAGDQRPILTNSSSLPRLIGFERARAGQGPIAHAVDPPAELVRRVRLIDRATCASPAGAADTEAGFYLVHFRYDGGLERQVCLARFGSLCHEMQPPAVGDDRSVWVYRCDPVAKR